MCFLVCKHPSAHPTLPPAERERKSTRLSPACRHAANSLVVCWGPRHRVATPVRFQTKANYKLPRRLHVGARKNTQEPCDSATELRSTSALPVAACHRPPLSKRRAGWGEGLSSLKTGMTCDVHTNLHKLVQLASKVSLSILHKTSHATRLAGTSEVLTQASAKRLARNMHTLMSQNE